MTTVVVTEIRRGVYLDSVSLMRIAREIAGRAGVAEAGLMIGTPANKAIMREAGILDAEGEAAAAGDLIVGIRARDGASAEAALVAARTALAERRTTAVGGTGRTAWRPRTTRAAVEAMPDANLALISVPGDFAVAEARKAIALGLDVMIFSDNVSLAEEVALKREALARGRLVMGPDCGTAIIAGMPLAFANVVPRGDIGIIGASGTGIQEVSCLIARLGRGVSHAIGTGGRDLKAEVGGITTLMAIDLLEGDPATRHIVLVSKPPAADVAEAVVARLARVTKPVTLCFLGGDALALPRHVVRAANLKEAAELATGARLPGPSPRPAWPARAGVVRGLFAGGTLCAEAQLVGLAAGLDVASNVPVPGARALAATGRLHSFVDLGDDVFTRGRPHPMIEPAVRDAPLAAALADQDTAVILLDCVLGFGGHPDPAGHLAGALVGRGVAGPAIIASITGTDADPQCRAAQQAKLEAVGVLVAPSNADAAALAAAIVDGASPCG